MTTFELIELTFEWMNSREESSKIMQSDYGQIREDYLVIHDLYEEYRSIREEWQRLMKRASYNNDTKYHMCWFYLMEMELVSAGGKDSDCWHEGLDGDLQAPLKALSWSGESKIG
jgi:hypothetical protein